MMRNDPTGSGKNFRTMREHSPDPYQVLHLGPAATAGDVTRAYRALMRTHHPDTMPPEALPDEQKSKADALHDIMDAYAILGDPAKRAEYDRQQQKPPAPKPGPPPRAHNPTGAALIIGPVRREYPLAPGVSQQAGGSPSLVHWTLIPAASTERQAAGGAYRIHVWIY